MFTLIKDGKKYLAYPRGEMYLIEDLGVIRKIEDGEMKIGTNNFVVIKSNLKDYLDTLKRKAQIIGLKDSSYIIGICGIRDGFRVVEGGVGSGSLTTSLLYFTYPSGHVYTYEMRREFADFARKNVERMEHEHWTLKIGDVRKDVVEREIDAFIVDIPDPWNAVPLAKKALKRGGCFSSYIPTYNQVEKTYKKLEEMNFVDISACEIIRRGVHVGPMGTRPENIEVAHTGFMVFGRKA